MNILPYTDKCAVYPGEYTPMPENEMLMQRLKSQNKKSGAGLPVTIHESKDCFKIQVIIPGVKRNEIFVSIQDTLLTVSVLHRDHATFLNDFPYQTEQDVDFFERHIRLPGNTDVELAAAEYHDGVLCMHIPKDGNGSSPGIKQQLVVY